MSISIKNFVLCDDVRKEISQKDILIGVYGSGIILPFFPVNMLMAFWAELLPSDIGVHECAFKFEFPGNEEPLLVPVALEVQRVETSTIAASGLPLSFQRDGELVIYFRDREDDWIEVSRKLVTTQAPS
jgi:hypothetical protein